MSTINWTNDDAPLSIGDVGTISEPMPIDAAFAMVQFDRHDASKRSIRMYLWQIQKVKFEVGEDVEATTKKHGWLSATILSTEKDGKWRIKFKKDGLPKDIASYVTNCPTKLLRKKYLAGGYTVGHRVRSKVAWEGEAYGKPVALAIGDSGTVRDLPDGYEWETERVNISFDSGYTIGVLPPQVELHDDGKAGKGMKEVVTVEVKPMGKGTGPDKRLFPRFGVTDRDKTNVLVEPLYNPTPNSMRHVRQWSAPVRKRPDYETWPEI